MAQGGSAGFNGLVGEGVLGGDGFQMFAIHRVGIYEFSGQIEDVGVGAELLFVADLQDDGDGVRAKGDACFGDMFAGGEAGQWQIKTTLSGLDEKAIVGKDAVVTGDGVVVR